MFQYSMHVTNEKEIHNALMCNMRATRTLKILSTSYKITALKSRWL